MISHVFKPLVAIVCITLGMGSIGLSQNACRPIEPKVKNVILMIGDGMGVAHVSATMIHEHHHPLAMERAHAVGLVKTHSANNLVTDSAAAATALSCGVKTNNGVIGQDPSGKTIKNLIEKAQDKGLSTGLVVTSSLTHATPAGFVAHVKYRGMEDEIAKAIVDSEVDVLIGGGLKFFQKREDKMDLAGAMKDKGYKVATQWSEIDSDESDQLCALLADKQMPYANENRGDYLAKATEKALDVLSAHKGEGFFLMVEGSLIDNGGHENNIDRIVSEVKDFDQAVQKAFDYADQHPDTLVIVTADHGTGGLSIISNSKKFTDSEKGLSYVFSTTSHSGEMVPLFAYGVKASEFSRVLENTDIPKIIARLLGLLED